MPSKIRGGTKDKHLADMHIPRVSALGAGGGAASPAFDPSSVSGLSRDWDFDAAAYLYSDRAHTTLVTADADPIGAILDKVGGTVYLIAPSDGERPTYKTNIQNGKSVGRFDGSDDYLTNTTGITADASQTIYIVLVKRSAPAAGGRVALATATSANLRTATGVSANGYVYNTNAAASGVDVGGTPTNWSIVVLNVASAASLSVYVNGGTPTTFDPHDDITLGTFMTLGATIAGTGDGDFDIGRVLVYSASHTTTQMDTVLSGLGTLWGITVTPTS